MLFRFCAAMSLVVLIASAGITLERRILDLKRQQTLQVYRLAQMEERYARLKLRCEELNAPALWIESLETAEVPSKPTRRR